MTNIVTYANFGLSDGLEDSLAAQDLREFELTGTLGTTVGWAFIIHKLTKYVTISKFFAQNVSKCYTVSEKSDTLYQNETVEIKGLSEDGPGIAGRGHYGSDLKQKPRPSLGANRVILSAISLQ